jgi:hypothetical protein
MRSFGDDKWEASFSMGSKLLRRPAKPLGPLTIWLHMFSKILARRAVRRY